jgi:hypothetical protein
MTIRADLGRLKGERGWLVLRALPLLGCGYLWTIPVRCRPGVTNSTRKWDRRFLLLAESQCPGVRQRSRKSIVRTRGSNGESTNP